MAELISVSIYILKNIYRGRDIYWVKVSEPVLLWQFIHVSFSRNELGHKLGPKLGHKILSIELPPDTWFWKPDIRFLLAVERASQKSFWKIFSVPILKSDASCSTLNHLLPCNAKQPGPPALKPGWAHSPTRLDTTGQASWTESRRAQHVLTRAAGFLFAASAAVASAAARGPAHTACLTKLLKWRSADRLALECTLSKLERSEVPGIKHRTWQKFGKI